MRIKRIAITVASAAVVSFGMFAVPSTAQAAGGGTFAYFSDRLPGRQVIQNPQTGKCYTLKAPAYQEDNESPRFAEMYFTSNCDPEEGVAPLPPFNNGEVSDVLSVKYMS